MQNSNYNTTNSQPTHNQLKQNQFHNKIKQTKIMNFSAANAYITSPDVASLNTTSDSIHDNLWPLFQQLLETNYEMLIQTSEWIYAKSFKFAVDSITKEHAVTISDILERQYLQKNFCFYFIMHIHH